MAPKSEDAINGLFVWPDGENKRLAKALDSAAFLLRWSSDAGNDPISGPIVNGLAFLLDECSEVASRLYSQDDVFNAGGDPRKLRDRKLTANPKKKEPKSSKPRRRDIDELNRLFKLGEEHRLGESPDSRAES